MTTKTEKKAAKKKVRELKNLRTKVGEEARANNRCCRCCRCCRCW